MPDSSKELTIYFGTSSHMFDPYINISLESTAYMTHTNLTNLIILSNFLHINKNICKSIITSLVSFLIK